MTALRKPARPALESFVPTITLSLESAAILLVGAMKRGLYMHVPVVTFGEDNAQAAVKALVHHAQLLDIEHEIHATQRAMRFAHGGELTFVNGADDAWHRGIMPDVVWLVFTGEMPDLEAQRRRALYALRRPTSLLLETP